MIKEAIVLAGGLGKRLRKVVKDVPKPMADVNGKPFLEYLLTFLARQKIEKVVLSVGYKYEVIKNYFGNSFSGMKLVYSIESKPLGTGGGIRRSLSFVDSNEAFVLNGDTFFDIDMEKLYFFHKEKNSVLSVALKPMRHFDRYGSVKLDKNNRIIGFEEKKYYESGLINGGIYLLNKNFFMSFALEEFSFEKDFLEKYYNSYAFYGLEFRDYFIDIGIPEDYEKFKKYAKKFLTKNMF
ncbi:MAG: NDP-sugar pyrophosphorylase [Thermodesulfobacterium sp.]|uniref:NDP-sugar pyrophosphorylase n=1 Tax=Candidatus Thermodesulfobacterium syntrophicum TaxID=3060442 RepID=A0AAE3TEE4_9BACT|nr:NDP-sugar pyrophosphorylase [Candidatus Thermodesulfobacterium syntrophicum]